MVDNVLQPTGCPQFSGMSISATSTHATKVKAAPLEPTLTKGVLGDILIARRDISLLCSLPGRQPKKRVDEPATHVSPPVERDTGARQDEDTGEEGPGITIAEEPDVDISGGNEASEPLSADDSSPQQRCSACVSSSRYRVDGARRSFPLMRCCREERTRQCPASSVGTASNFKGTHGATDSAIHPQDLTDTKGASGVSTANLVQMMQSRRRAPRSAITKNPHPVANSSKPSCILRTEFIANIVQLHHGASSESQRTADGRYLSARGDLRPKDVQCGTGSITGKSEERTVTMTVLVGLLSHDTLEDRGLALSSLFLSDETGKRDAGIDVPNAWQSFAFFTFAPACSNLFQYVWVLLTCII